MKKIYSIGWIILGSIIIWYSFFLYTTPSHHISLEKSEILLKNLSWDTDFLDPLPYKKWDLLEMHLILKQDGVHNVTLNLEKLKQKISLDEISVNGTPKTKDTIQTHDGSIITIKGKWKENGILKKDDYQDIIKEIIPKDEIIPEEKNEEPTQEEMLTSQNIDIRVLQTHLNSNINNLVEFQGTGSHLIKYINIWWNSFTPIRENEKQYISIPKNMFPSWEYFILYQLSDGTLITSKDSLTTTFDKNPVNIANITPKNISSDTKKNLTLQWNGFEKVIWVWLSNNLILKKTSFEILSDQVLVVHIPTGLENGSYFLNIMTTSGIYELKKNIFYISQ